MSSEFFAFRGGLEKAVYCDANEVLAVVMQIFITMYNNVRSLAISNNYLSTFVSHNYDGKYTYLI